MKKWVLHLWTQHEISNNYLHPLSYLQLQPFTMPIISIVTQYNSYFIKIEYLILKKIIRNFLYLAQNLVWSVQNRAKYCAKSFCLAQPLARGPKPWQIFLFGIIFAIVLGMPSKIICNMFSFSCRNYDLLCTYTNIIKKNSLQTKK